MDSNNQNNTPDNAYGAIIITLLCAKCKQNFSFFIFINQKMSQ